MIFGGLEIIAGGYFIHRYHKKKNELEKQRLEDEAQTRRHHTFPGAKPNGWNTQAQHRPQHHQQPVIPQQKYACYAPVPMTAPPQFQCQAEPQRQPRPQPPTHTQSFNIPRRPLPQRKPEIIIQPSLQRTDSFATLSRMPIANGSRPQDAFEEQSPAYPPRRYATGLQPIPQHSVYGNAGFSVSTPAFGATPTSPPLTYAMATGHEGGHTVDDNWETYEHHYAPTVSTQLGERDPPPPYAP
ncbi:Nn.00g014490.m01.CDS01 [Neocucurbitaria sp. VM-36]